MITSSNQTWPNGGICSWQPQLSLSSVTVGGTIDRCIESLGEAGGRFAKGKGRGRGGGGGGGGKGGGSHAWRWKYLATRLDRSCCSNSMRNQHGMAHVRLLPIPHKVLYLLRQCNRQVVPTSIFLLARVLLVDGDDDAGQDPVLSIGAIGGGIDSAASRLGGIAEERGEGSRARMRGEAGEGHSSTSPDSPRRV